MSSGWLTIDKPLGLTSVQIVGKTRSRFKLKKMGHIGTLDPLASGVLTLAIGEATKLIPYLPARSKIYEFDVRWGEARDTDDAEGQIINQSTVYPSLQEIKNSLPNFIGHIEQAPPLYSAIKNQGIPAYKLARKGLTPSLSKRTQIIYNFEITAEIDYQTTSFKVECNSGTYIRSLARDLALSLGTFGYVSKLRRLHDGLFSINETFPLEKVLEISHKSNEHLLIKPLTAVLDDIPAVLISSQDVHRIRQGLNIRNSFNQVFEESQPIALFCEQELIAIAKIKEDTLWPCRVFNSTT